MLKHGHAVQDGKASPTYNTWAAMKSRCNNRNNPKFPMYGGSGITVCERWHKFANFLEDMGERPNGTSIDRIDGSKGYYKENCRWATPHQQQNNLKNNKFITFMDVTFAQSEWAAITGVHYSSIRYRLKRGWTIEQALMTPEKLGQVIKKTACKMLTAFGETLPVREWSDRYGVRVTTINERIRRGIPVEVAITYKQTGFKPIQLEDSNVCLS